MSWIGRYELGRLLGRGGQGTVYEAVLHGAGGFRKRVALEVLHTGDGLLREARIGGLLRHLNLVDVYEVGEQDGTWFCAMEYCAGGTLASCLPLPPRAAVRAGNREGASALLARAAEVTERLAVGQRSPIRVDLERTRAIVEG